MRTSGLFSLLVLVLLAGTLTPLGAQGRGRANSHTGNTHNDPDASVRVVFGDGELRMIRAWFGDSHNLHGLPPGLAKRDSLPPGLQRQLQRNGTLPPGLQAHIHSVPADLHHRLPTLIEGISRVIIGGQIVLVNDRTNVILDVAAIF